MQMRWFALALLAATVCGCRAEKPQRAHARPAPGPASLDAFTSLREVPSPATDPSGEPFLAVSPHGDALISWIESASHGKQRFRYASRSDGRWSVPQTIIEGDNLMLNWADVPSIAPLADGRLAAHYLFTRDKTTYAYGVALRIGDPARRQWSEALVPHRDDTATEHGFASLADAAPNGVDVVWLDGRDFALQKGGVDRGASVDGDMALRATTIGADGRLGEEVVVDPRVCDCCPTAATRTPRGLIVAYRNRSADETRDIFVVRNEGGRWTEPMLVSGDKWQLAGCPVNGPALTSRDNHVALAWFTAANNEARVKVAFSSDGGLTFGKPVQVNDGIAAGRVDVALLEDEVAAVSWIEFAERGATLSVRRIASDGRRGPTARVADVRRDRSSGYPRMVRAGNDLVFAWTAAGNPTRVKTAAGRIVGPSGQ